MARLWSSGFEMNSTTANVEWTSASGTIVTSPVKSGLYAGRSNPSASTQRFTYSFDAGVTGVAVTYYRFYMRIASLPASLNSIAYVNAEDVALELQLNSSGTLELWDNLHGVQIGSDSSALSINTWYRIEVSVDLTTLSSTTLTAKIDGVTFATGSANYTGWTVNSYQLVLGGVTSGTYDIYFDDVAINDNSGSFQNSWPGPGAIVHLRPRGPGDNEQFGRGGIDGGAGTNWNNAKDVTPNDATDFLYDTSPNQIDDYKIDRFPYRAVSITCVQVGFRFAVDVTGGTAAQMAVRCKAAPGGTVEEGTTITTNSTSYQTNTTAAPRNYQLTMYDLPGADTTAWKVSDLNTAQIGVNLSNDPTNTPRFTAVWMLVDYVPEPATGFIVNNLRPNAFAPGHAR